MLIKSATDSGADEIEVDASSNKNASGEYWTRIINSDQVNISIDFPEGVPTGESCEDVELASINLGVRGFGSSSKSGSCNIDVVCPLREGWEMEIQSVAGYSFGGSLFCTGAMINNKRQDAKP